METGNRWDFGSYAARDHDGYWSTGVLECWKKLKPGFTLE
jgi:hypothetical protein